MSEAVKNLTIAKKQEFLVNLVAFRNLYNENCYLDGSLVSSTMGPNILIYDLQDIRAFANSVRKPVVIESLQRDSEIVYHCYFEAYNLRFETYCNLREVIKDE